MSITKALDKFFSRFSSQLDKPIIDRVAASSHLDEVRNAAESALTTLATPQVQDALQKVLGGQVICPEAVRLKEIYHRFLTAQMTTYEHRGYLQSFVPTLQGALSDLTLIQHQYADLFGSHGPAQPTAGELRLASAIVIGYIERVAQSVSWLNNFMILAMGAITPTAPATRLNFMFNNLIHNSDDVSAMVSEVASRRRSQNLLTLIDALEKRGRNTLLAVGKHTVDQYIADSDLTHVEGLSVSGFIRSPMLMLGTHSVVRAQLKSKQLRDEQEFLQCKIAYYQRKQMVGNTTDAELTHLAELEANFRRLLANTQEKIDAADREYK